MKWCSVCNTQHRTRGDCPGELLATGPERHGRRLVVLMGTRREAFGVLLAEAGELWRARVLTYPNMLWTVPGGRGTMKFVGDRPEQAEKKAVDFLRELCCQRGYQIIEDEVAVESRPVAAEDASNPFPDRARDHRHLRQLPVRYTTGETTRAGVTGDLSKGGLFIATDRPAPQGGALKLLLQLGHFSVPLAGRVAWVRTKPESGRPAGMGVQLDRPSAMYRRYVRTLEQEQEEDPTGAG